MTHRPAAVLLLVLAVLTGCRSSTPPNPPLPETRAEAREALREMSEDPAEATRPLVVIGGWGDFVWGMGATAEKLDATRTGPMAERTVIQNHGLFGSFDRNRARLIAAVDEALATDDPDQTVPVDVVGFSMGGLLARYAAMPEDRRGEPARRLNVARLSTVSTPHRGARMAWASPLEAPARDMKPGSPFLAYLDTALPDPGYALVVYGRNRDATVGWARAAPEGMTLNWVPSPWWQRGHADAKKDPRILADIARRLRGE